MDLFLPILLELQRRLQILADIVLSCMQDSTNVQVCLYPSVKDLVSALHFIFSFPWIPQSFKQHPHYFPSLHDVSNISGIEVDVGIVLVK
jgi:hypothetical protein